jgi:crotonobetainyl-CoA:carnitine CoA-transferase CaiB-like acyl-CoA transferase
VLAALVDAGVPAAPVVAPHSLHQDPQMRARGFWEQVEHPVIGPQWYAGFPYRLDADRWFAGPAPLLGQHNDEILTEAGLTVEEIAALRDDHVIGDRPLGL